MTEEIYVCNGCKRQSCILVNAQSTPNRCITSEYPTYKKKDHSKWQKMVRKEKPVIELCNESDLDWGSEGR